MTEIIILIKNDKSELKTREENLTSLTWIVRQSLVVVVVVKYNTL